jgi:hypothetical protein
LRKLLYGIYLMRRFAVPLAALIFASAVTPVGAPALAQDANLPPHAWLFGTWTGGIFPAPSGLSNQACLSQPIVIFTRDLVLRATITEQLLTQREIETARTSPQGAEFRFAAAGAGSGLLGIGTGPAVGFGCQSPDELHVQRRGDNEIVFPGCADFPNPLVRCHTR